MILDTSALVAIVEREPESDEFTRLVVFAPHPRIAAPSLLEAGIVIDGRRDPVVRRRFDELVDEMGISVETFTAEHARIAREAYRDFGRGSGHPARLNFGDCMAYALAKATDEPLLFKGDDFSKTDIRSAL